MSKSKENVSNEGPTSSGTNSAACFAESDSIDLTGNSKKSCKAVLSIDKNVFDMFLARVNCFLISLMSFGPRLIVISYPLAGSTLLSVVISKVSPPLLVLCKVKEVTNTVSWFTGSVNVSTRPFAP